MSHWLPVLVLAAMAACTGQETPPREKTAAYFGLKDNFELLYDVSGTGVTPSETKHIYRKNDSFADELAFSREQRNAANFIEETLILAARDEDLRLLRVGDCVDDCTTYADPPVIMANPVIPNSSFTTESTTTIRALSGGMYTTTQGKERHEIIVGAEKDVPTPAGTFKAVEVAWTTTFPDEPMRAAVVRTLLFSENKGVVQFTQDGKTYKLKSGLTP